MVWHRVAAESEGLELCSKSSLGSRVSRRLTNRLAHPFSLVQLWAIFLASRVRPLSSDISPSDFTTPSSLLERAVATSYLDMGVWRLAVSRGPLIVHVAAACLGLPRVGVDCILEVRLSSAWTILRNAMDAGWIHSRARGVVGLLRQCWWERSMPGGLPACLGNCLRS